MHPYGLARPPVETALPGASAGSCPARDSRPVPGDQRRRDRRSMRREAPVVRDRVSEMRTSLLVGTVVLGVAAAVATPVLGALVGGGTESSRVVAVDRARLTARAGAVAAPAAEVLFNDPTGDVAAQDRIADHVLSAI